MDELANIDFKKQVEKITGKAPKKTSAKKKAVKRGEGQTEAQDLKPVLEMIADFPNTLKEAFEGVTISVNVPQSSVQPAQSDSQTILKSKSIIQADGEMLRIDELIVKYGTFYENLQTFGITGLEFSRSFNLTKDRAREKLLRFCILERSEPRVQEAIAKHKKSQDESLIYGIDFQPKQRSKTFLFLVPKENLTHIKKKLGLE